MEEKKSTVADFIREIEEFCEKNGRPVPQRVKSNQPMVIIPSKSLEEKFKKHCSKKQS